DIAQIIGTTQQHYSRCEQGECDLQTRAIIKLADFYNVSTDYLLGRTECQQGIEALNQSLVGTYTTGRLMTEILSLNNIGRCAVVEYIGLQKLKEKIHKTRE
ncbi:MAG TPA: helix-turn-helix transcriptional regulator, partial [Desulfitobacterium dehalogenans]|nr:helix-turn-helix transcriptional regulator [Desulfitobacterium dehalogenans]